NGIAFIGMASTPGALANGMHAISLTTHHQKWFIPIASGVTHPAAFDGTSLYFVDFSGTLHSVDAVTGATHWTVAAGDAYATAPLVKGTVIYMADGGTTASLTAFSTSDGHQLWRSFGHSFNNAVPSYYNGEIL